jgi:hypothetical protein
MLAPHSMASDIPPMKAAMSDDGGDSIEEQIQAHYQKFQREPGNPKHAFAIGNLYEKRNEYVNAVPWFEAAFDLGGRVDAALERRVFEMKCHERLMRLEMWGVVLLLLANAGDRCVLTKPPTRNFDHARNLRSHFVRVSLRC